jgi:hypothetical protein
MQLPQSDPSVQRIVKSLWVGHKKITLDTVLTSQFISDQIVQYQRITYNDTSTCNIVDMEMKMFRRRTVNDLRVLLTYLIKNPVAPPSPKWYSCFTR